MRDSCDWLRLWSAAANHSSPSSGHILSNKQELMQNQIRHTVQNLSNARLFSPDCLLRSFNEIQLKNMFTSCKCSRLRKSRLQVRRLVEHCDLQLESMLSDANDGDRDAQDLRILFREAVEKWMPPKEIFRQLECSLKPIQFPFKTGPSQPTGSDEISLEENYDTVDLWSEQHERVLSTAKTKTCRTEDIEWFESQASSNQPRLLESASVLFSATPDTSFNLFTDPWELDDYSRAKLVQFSLHRRIKEIEYELESLVAECRSLHRQREELETACKLDCVVDKKVIGMTITGASMHYQLL